MYISSFSSYHIFNVSSLHIYNVSTKIIIHYKNQQNKEIEPEKSDSSINPDTNETKPESNGQVQPASKFGFMSRFFKGKRF